jgi:hypothetical protein
MVRKSVGFGSQDQCQYKTSQNSMAEPPYMTLLMHNAQVYAYKCYSLAEKCHISVCDFGAFDDGNCTILSRRLSR